MIRATQFAPISLERAAGRYRCARFWRSSPAADGDDGTRGLEFLLDLESAVALRGGDALVLEDGKLVEVVAAPEPLAEIRGSDPQHLVRLAWHLGNRHLPTQITARGLRIRRDHVIEAMVQGLWRADHRDRGTVDPEGAPMRTAAMRTHRPARRTTMRGAVIIA